MNGTKAPKTVRGTAWLVALCLCMFASGAVADGLMPMMPAPPQTPVYWQLTSIVQEPTVTKAGGYDVSYRADGLSLDLSDGLMAQSFLENDAETWTPKITLTISKDGTAMEHVYGWTALPVYLEPNTAYEIDITGVRTEASGSLNSLLYVYEQGAMLARISAGGYTGHADAAAFTIDTASTSLYNDGSLVYSFILRDVNDMFRLRVVYTYQMEGGVKPEPTPVPGFVAVDMPAGVLPGYYEPVPGKEGLWTVTTEPGEYRAYGSMSGSEAMFFPADADGNVVMDEKPAEPQADYDAFVKGFVPVEPASVPENYTEANPGLYSFITRDGETYYRRYGRVDGGEPAFYPADAEGTVAAETAAPVVPADDYTEHVEGFGTAQPDTPDAHYRMVAPGVYAFTGRDGETQYRVYGRLNGAEPAYYPADETGALPENAAPVNPDDDFVQYIKGFDPTEPPPLPAFYEQVEEGIFAVTDREGNPVYRVYGIKDGEAPAFYPSDVMGNVAEDALPITPDEDFMAYIVGFEPVEMPDAPFYYDETDVPNVWTFEDLNGQRQYRTYGILNRGEEAYYPSDEQGDVEHDALPVQPASDLANMPAPKFVRAVPETVPAHYEAVPGTESTYTFADRAGQPMYRTYGAYGRAMPQFYPADADGNPVQDADPVDPAQDFATYFAGFEPMTPSEVPSYYSAVEGDDSAFQFEGKDGQTIRRVYGSKDRSEPAFYPADDQGNPVEAAEPVKPADDFAEHIEGFAPMTPSEVPSYYEPVEGATGVYQFAGRDGEPVLRVYGAKDRGEPAFYPADDQGNPVEAAEPVKPADDFAEHIEGFAPMTPAEVPSYYRPGDREGLYTFETREGDVLHRVYGSRDRAEPAYYPSDAEGNPTSDVPLEPSDEVPFLPTPLTGGVVTPAAEQAPETTPIARAYGSGDLWPEATTQTNTVVTPTAEQLPETTPITRAYGSGDLWPEATTQTNAVVTPGADQTPETTPVTREYGKGELWPEATTLTGTVNPAASPTEGQTGVGTELPPVTPAPTTTSASIVQPETTDADIPVISSVVSADPTDTPEDEPSEAPTQEATSATGTAQPQGSQTAQTKPTEEVTAEPTTELRTEPGVTPSSATGNSETKETESPTEAPTPAPEEAKGSSNWWIALVAGGAVLIGGGGFFLFRKKK